MNLFPYYHSASSSQNKWVCFENCFLTNLILSHFQLSSRNLSTTSKVLTSFSLWTSLCRWHIKLLVINPSNINNFLFPTPQISEWAKFFHPSDKPAVHLFPFQVAVITDQGGIPYSQLSLSYVKDRRDLKQGDSSYILRVTLSTLPGILLEMLNLRTYPRTAEWESAF